MGRDPTTGRRTWPFRNHGRQGRAVAGLGVALSSTLRIMLGLAATCVLALHLLCEPLLAQAAEPPQLAVRAGYHGQVPTSGWVPVEVTARNVDGTLFRGYVDILQLGGVPGGFPPGAPAGGGHRMLARWRFPIEIPPGGTRSLAPLIRMEPGFSYRVDLLTEAGQPVASIPFQPAPLGDQNTIIVVVAERPIPYLGGMPGLRGGSVVAVEARPELLPRISAAWFSFDAVVIDGIDPLRRLEPAQLEALRLWVELGGTLVLGTGSDASAMAQVLGSRLFPWTVRGTVETADYTEPLVLARRLDPDAPALGEGAPASVAAILEPLPASPGGSSAAGETPPATPAPGDGAAPGPAAAQRGAVPLAYQAQVGLGRVYAWATRLDTEPWLSWTGAPAAFAGWIGSDLVPANLRRADAFLVGQAFGVGRFGPPGIAPGSARVLPVNIPLGIDARGPRELFLAIARTSFPNLPFTLGRDMLLDAARDMPGLQLPSSGVLAAGIAGYLLLIGPLTFAGLGRLRKREWAWLVVPAVALLAVGGAYLAGTATRAGVSRNAAGFLLVSPRGDGGMWSGRVASYRSAGTPRVELVSRALVGSVPEDLQGGPGSIRPVPGDMLRVEPTPGGQQVSWPANTAGQIAASLVQVDVVLPGSLQATWRPAGGDQWQVEVVNGLDLPLHKPFILLGNQVLAQLPDLAPGDRYTGRVQVAPRPGFGQWLPPSPSFTSLTPPAGGGSPPRDWRWRQEARLKTTLGELGAGTAGGALLAARIDGSPVFATGGAGGLGTGGGSPGGAVADGTTARENGSQTGGRAGAGDLRARWGGTGTTLLIQPLTVQLPSPDGDTPAFRVSNTVFPLEAREARAAGIQTAGPGASVDVDTGTLEFEWRPPAPLVPRARALVIEVAGAGISFYDHETARWVVLRPPGGRQLPADAPAWARQDVQVDDARVQVRGASLHRLLAPDGRLALRLEVTGQASLSFPLVTLDVAGEVNPR